MELRKQILDLQQAITDKKMFTGYSKERELEDMIKIALRQNKKVADKVDYLMDSMIEASQTENYDVLEKSVTLISKAQLEIIKELESVKEDVKNASSLKQLLESQQSSLKMIGEKIQSFEKIIDELPHSQQISALKFELNGIVQEIKAIESKIISSPNDVSVNLGLIQKDVETMKSRLENLSSEVSEISKEDKSAHIKLDIIENLSAKISSVEEKIKHFDELVSSGRAVKDDFFKNQIEKIEKEVGEIQHLKELVDNISRTNNEDKEKTAEIINSIKKIESDLAKMNDFIGKNSKKGIGVEKKLLDEKTRDLSVKILEVKDEELKEAFQKKTEFLKKQIDAISESFDYKKKDAMMQDLTEDLEELEEKMKKAVLDSKAQKQIDDLYSDVSILEQKTENEEEIDDTLIQIEKRISAIEKFISKKSISHPHEITEMEQNIKSAKENISNAEGNVDAMRIARLQGLVEKMKVPDTAVENHLPSIEKKLKKVSENVPEEHEERVNEIIERVDDVTKQSLKSEKESFNSKLVSKQLKEESENIVISEISKIREYIQRIPRGIQITAEELASQLNIPYNDVIDALQKIQKESPDLIELFDFNFMAKVSGKKPIILRK